MASIHAEAFAGGEIWSEEDIATLMTSPHVHAISLSGAGFALFRVIPPEAELLTLAIAPAHQGKGLGHDLMTRTLGQAGLAGAERLFLEVDALNSVARALYDAHGFVEAGRRRAYYAQPDGTRSDALVLTAHILSK